MAVRNSKLFNSFPASLKLLLAYFGNYVMCFESMEIVYLSVLAYNLVASTNNS